MPALSGGRALIAQAVKRTAKPALGPGPTYRRAIAAGLGPEVATNLTAYLAGLPLHGIRPWSLKTVQALVFLRWAREHGRIAG